VKRKIKIVDLIRAEGREPGGVGPKIFVSYVTPRIGGLTLLDLAKRQGDELFRTMAVALERKSDILESLRE